MRLTDIPAAAGVLDGSETVLGLKGGAATRLPYVPLRAQGVRTALLGDSITALNGTTRLSAGGYFSWTNILSGHRFSLDPSDNHGLSGDTLDGFGGQPGMASRVAAVLASDVDLCIVLGGVNDVVLGNSAPAMQAAMRDRILLPLLSAGLQVVVLPILCRSGLDATQTLVKARFNTWLREFCAGRADLWNGLSPMRRLLLVDPTDAVEDKTTGAWLSGYAQADGLHPSVRGAFQVGKVLAEVLNVFHPPRPTHMLSFGDLFDAEDNPSGNLLVSDGVNLGLMVGAGGERLANAGLTPTGAVATGWKIFRGFGDSAATLVGAKEYPRSDTASASGERQRLTVTVTGVGSGDEGYSLLPADHPAVSPGDEIYAECSVEVAGTPVNLRGLNFTVAAGDASAADCAADTAGYAPSGFKGVLRTPVITVPAGATGCTAYLQAVVDATSGAAWADVLVGDFVIRKRV